MTVLPSPNVHKYTISLPLWLPKQTQAQIHTLSLSFSLSEISEETQRNGAPIINYYQ